MLGNPGCGKSTVIRDIIEPLTRDKQWAFELFNDYEILKVMSTENDWKDKFDVLSTGGFNILDFTAFDVALKRLEEKINHQFAVEKPPVSVPLLVLIEFARNDYTQAFGQFSDEFLQGAYYLYLDTPLPICRQRVRERIAKPPEDKSEDDYYVPDFIFDVYYSHEDTEPLSEVLRKFGVDERHFLMVENNADLEDNRGRIEEFTQSIANGQKPEDQRTTSASSYQAKSPGKNLFWNIYQYL